MRFIRGSKARDGGRESSFARLCLWGGIACCVIGLIVFLRDGGGEYNASGQRVASSSLSSGVLSRLGLGGSTQRTVRKTEVGDTFGTIFHSELMSIIKFHEGKAGQDKLLATLQEMERTRIQTVIFSISWDWFAPSETKLRWDYLNGLAETTCKGTGLKMGLIIDVMRAPGWVFKKFPDCKAQDAGGRNYTNLSWFHEETNRMALGVMKQMVENLAKNYTGCVVSIQPVYNNEYEAKFTQEYDSYQDYNVHAVNAFRSWVKAKRPQLGDVNTRWGTNFKEWADVRPPAIVAGTLMGIEDSSRYWDWMKFREIFGANVFNRACAVVKSAGLQCFHHFPEFFSVLDAMYGASMFKHIAASEHTDFLIMDSNFRTPYGTVMNPHKLRIYVAAAQPYGKKMYFEAAVERYASMELLQAGFKNSLLAGAENLGITNWLTRIDMNSSLHDAMYAPSPCKATELVGVFIHLDSCLAWQGLQWNWKRKDPLHDFIEDMAERLTEKCETDITVYIELDRFLADMHTFNRAVFVEPVVLYGTEELGAYVAAKTALHSLPHQVLHLPTNNSRGLSLKVLSEL